MAAHTRTTTRRAVRCTKHAFAPSARIRPRSDTAGDVTLPGHGHIRAHARNEHASGTSGAGNDPVNVTDPLGLWGWNPISDATQAWNDTGGKAVSYVHKHKQAFEVGAGIALGVLAAGTGVGAIIEVAAGSAVLGAGLGLASVGAGVTAAALDNGACSHGDTAACLGRDFGYVGAGLGFLATGAAGAAALGLISLEGTTAAVLGGLGTMGLNIGLAGTTMDIYGALGRDNCR